MTEAHKPWTAGRALETKRAGAVNYEAWARNAVAFIRMKDMESEFSDWCGGFPVPVGATADMQAASPDMAEALPDLANAVEAAWPNLSQFEPLIKARAALAKAGAS